jgi:chromosome segregation ATPase
LQQKIQEAHKQMEEVQLQKNRAETERATIQHERENLETKINQLKEENGALVQKMSDNEAEMKANERRTQLMLKDYQRQLGKQAPAPVESSPSDARKVYLFYLARLTTTGAGGYAKPGQGTRRAPRIQIQSRRRGAF